MSLPSDAGKPVRTVAALLAACVALAASPAAAQTTLGDGTNPTAPAQPVCPAPNPPATVAGTPVDAFTFRSAVNDVINSIRVQLSPAGAYKVLERIEIRSAVDQAQLFGSVQPASDLEMVFLTQPINLVANAPAQSFVIVAVPKPHAAMARSDAGLLVKVTARVNTFSTTTSRVFGDTASTLITIDNQAPAEVIWDTATADASSATLRWKGTPSVVVLRRQNGPVTDRPTEGTTYSPGAPMPGGSVVVYAGAGVMPADTAVTANRPYYYTVFTKDDCNNYSAGSSVGPLVPGGTAEGDAARPSYKAVVGLLNPLPGTVTSPFRVQVRVFSPHAANDAVQPVGLVELGVDSGSGYQWQPMQRNTAYGNAVDSGIWEILPNGLSLTAGSYTVRARATSSASATPVYSGAIGIVVSAVKGDGNLLVRDNSGQLCGDCHKNVLTHSSEVTGTEQGSWYVGCRGCHDPHGATNSALIADEITPPGVRGNYGPSRVYFAGKTGYSATGGAANPSQGAYANGDPGNAAGAPHTGVCQVCHTTTQFWTRTGAVSDHYGDQKCTSCHSHEKGMAASCNGCHGNAGRASIAGADALQTAAPPRAVSGSTATTDPAVGQHEKHVNAKKYRSAPLACAECHLGASHASPAEPGNAQVFFGALATKDKPDASYVRGGSCAVYCHGVTLKGGANKTPSWTETVTIGCDTCHGRPPAMTDSHPRNLACGSCHPADYAAVGADLTKHIDQNLDVTTSGCTSCHGTLAATGVTLTNNLQKAAPGVDAGSVDVTGNTLATKSGVGAHAAHLTGTRLRESGGAACVDCHQLPPSDLDLSHATGSGTNGARATVRFSAFATKSGPADYVNATSAGADTTSGSCASTYCHGAGYQDPAYKGSNQAPSWAGGASQAACGTCHKAPPTSTAHGLVNASTNCGMCHEGYAYTLAGGGTLGPKHLNGSAEYSAGCTTCHGTDGVNAAPPAAVTNRNNPNAIGAHQSHVNTASMKTRSAAYGCDECHVVPSGGHPNSVMDMAWNLSPTTNWQPGPSTCATAYCHGGTLAQASWGGGAATPNWLTFAGDTYRQCSSCHQSPPPLASGHPANTACDKCHPDGASTTGIIAGSPVAALHVNGQTNVDRTGCTQCHGDLNVTVDRTSLASAPGYFNGTSVTGADLDGATTGSRVGAHRKHLQSTSLRGTPVSCDQCHQVPLDNDKAHATDAGSTGARALLSWGSEATRGGGAAPGYNAGTCNNTYCHGRTLAGGSNKNPQWTQGAQGCGACHGAVPPISATVHHPQNQVDDCSTCHGAGYTSQGATPGITVGAASTHMNGGPNESRTGCTLCHGDLTATNVDRLDERAAPGYNANSASTRGFKVATSPAVGAHQKHLLGTTLRNNAAACDDCHKIPDAGDRLHADGVIANGVYADFQWSAFVTASGTLTPSYSGGNSAGANTLAGSCSNTYCHGGKWAAATPASNANYRGSKVAPSWTDTTAVAASCTSCHQSPPANTAHSSVTSGSGVNCSQCHGAGYDCTVSRIAAGTCTVDKAQHIDGSPDVSTACYSCHGQDRVANAGIQGPLDTTNNQKASPPTDSLGAATGNRVGPHQAHANPNPAQTEGQIDVPVLCSECHGAAVNTYTTSHYDGTIQTVAPGLGTSRSSRSLVTPAITTGSPYTCANYCHGASLTAGQKGSVTTWSWNTTTVTCGSCHKMPPSEPVHVALATTTDPKTCAPCHNTTVDGTTGKIIFNAGATLHINGTKNNTAACNSCHGSATNNAPPKLANSANTNATGAHQVHVNATNMKMRSAAFACIDCHPNQTQMNHANGTVDWGWSTLAGSGTTYNDAASTCASNYCHGGANATPAGATVSQNNWGAGAPPASPVWTTSTGGAGLGCGACHGAPPALSTSNPHPPNNACDSCHPAGSSTTAMTAGSLARQNHVNSTVNVNRTGCAQCHGDLSQPNVLSSAPLNAAPGVNGVGVDINGSPSGARVGAHRRHLQTLPTGWGVGTGGTRVTAIACGTCHSVPSSTTHATGVSPNAGARATVGLTVFVPGGTYASGTCSSVYCHAGDWAANTAVRGTAYNPTWTATNLNCGSCHQSPPSDASHTGVLNNKNCNQCHGAGYDCVGKTGGVYQSASLGACVVDATSHIDGTPTTVGMSCGSCHGSGTDRTNATAKGVVNATNLRGSPPNDLAGSATSNIVGAHLSHLNPAGASQIHLPLKCSDCHATASDTYGLGHADSTRTVTLVNSTGANYGSGVAVAWTAGSPGSCVTYCHGDRLPAGASVTLAQFQGTQTTWSWSPSAPAATCTSCHAFPPDPTGKHAGNTAYTACVGCHAETVNADATGSTFPTIKFTGTGATAATKHMNGQVDGGISTGGLVCTSCHNAIYTSMNSATHRHTLTSATPPAVGGNYAVATNQQNCVQCHVDHDKFNATPGANLRNSATVATPTATATDHSGTTGVCVSCHGTNTFAKASGGNTITVNGTSYGSSAHDYTTANPTSTFTRGGTFTANCSKCHGGSSTQFQSSTNKFALHNSTQASMLNPLGGANAEEAFCYRCHSNSGEAGKSVSANDYYGSVTTMPAGSTGIYAASSTVGQTAYTTTSSATLYLRNATTINTVTVTKPAAYQYSSGTYTTNTFTQRDMAPAAGTTAATTNISTGTTASRYNRGLQFVSPPIDNTVTIPSGSTFNLTLRENRALGTSTDNTRFTVYRWNGTTATPFNTTAAPGNFGQNATAISTTATNRTTTLTTNQAVTLNPGDAIVVDVEYLHSAGTTALNVTYTYGNFTGDAGALALPAGTYNWRTGSGVRYGHAVGSYSNLHKPGETGANLATAKHVECVDCHGPHAAKAGRHAGTGATSTNIAGNVLLGAAGVKPTVAATSWTAPTGYTAVTLDGTATNGLEAYVCFRCHSNNNTAVVAGIDTATNNGAGWSGTTPSGAVAFTNTALEFSTSNKSYHPVLGALPASQASTTAGSVQLQAARLNNGWVPGRTMTCTDCHNAETSSVVTQGPHGSASKFMLAGTNRRWPYQKNGTTLFGLNSYTADQNTADGLFCLNCHPINDTNNFHLRLSTGGTHTGWANATFCVSCHIVVPHGGKVSRLVITAPVPATTTQWSSTTTVPSNVPAPYKLPGTPAVAYPLAKIGKPTSNANVPAAFQATCNDKHTTGADSW